MESVLVVAAFEGMVRVLWGAVVHQASNNELGYHTHSVRDGATRVLETLVKFQALE